MKPAIPETNLTPDQQTFDDELKKNAKRGYKNLISQIQSEYDVAYWHIKPKWDEWLVRLSLYNNQRRDKTAIGDPLLFTIHQTVLAALYDDRLAVNFSPRERGDVQTSENLTYMAEFDHDEMGKPILDYVYDWDATFYGHALMDMRGFNRVKKCPMPFVVDPMTVLRDPRAVSVNGYVNGMNGSRFIGREFRATKKELEDAGKYFNLDSIGKADADSYSAIDINKQQRQTAQGLSPTPGRSITGENAEYRLLEWFTMYRGQRVLVTLAKERTVVVGFQVLSSLEIPWIDRMIYPMSHDWDGVSIPDIIEDKQRARAAIANLTLQGVKAKLYPMYLFDTNKVKNRNDLNFGFNKHVPVDGSTQGAVDPIQRQGVDQGVQFILEFLDRASQTATATPQLQQGQTSSVDRTLGELQMIDRKVDTRYSLSAKIFGWSEKEFWSRWYSLYKEHFVKDIDEKVIRIAGALAPRWRTLTRDSIVANVDPDIDIESKALAEAKRIHTLQGLQQYLAVALTDPNSSKRYAMKRLGKALGLHQDDIDFIMPPTIDEYKAEVENESLEKDKLMMVEVDDDHIAHMEIHNNATDTPAKYAHIQAHKRAMYAIKKDPNLATPQPSTTGSPDVSLLGKVAGNNAATPTPTMAGARPTPAAATPVTTPQ